MAPDRSFAETVAELGTLLGLSRPAGQCFAVIWRAARPPCADDLTAALGLSRSNVSTALKELRDWGLISRVRAPADRKDYFTAPPDPWEILRLLIGGWQRRAIAPLVDRLLAGAPSSGDGRASALHAALATVSSRLETLPSLGAARLSAAFESRPGKDPANERGTPRKKKKKGKG
ncbi:MAG: GbsR/MarR family transcriptional regulator [Albidovulum sp.]